MDKVVHLARVKGASSALLLQIEAAADHMPSLGAAANIPLGNALPILPSANKLAIRRVLFVIALDMAGKGR